MSAHDARAPSPAWPPVYVPDAVARLERVAEAFEALGADGQGAALRGAAAFLKGKEPKLWEAVIRSAERLP